MTDKQIIEKVKSLIQERNNYKYNFEIALIGLRIKSDIIAKQNEMLMDKFNYKITLENIVNIVPDYPIIIKYDYSNSYYKSMSTLKHSEFYKIHKCDYVILIDLFQADCDLYGYKILIENRG